VEDTEGLDYGHCRYHSLFVVGVKAEHLQGQRIAEISLYEFHLAHCWSYDQWGSWMTAQQ